MGEGIGISVGERDVYLALQRANKQPIQNLARLVRVANVLKRLGAVLAADIEHHLLTATATMSAYARSVALPPGRTPPCAPSAQWRGDRVKGSGGESTRHGQGKQTYGCSSTKLVQSYTLSWTTMYRSFLEACSETSE